ncbi:unnamed protein product [Phytophthora fragariaefolia]|uniref:Unnamed protein product n=1 Tax=Phytophthora fragariaefolia TaxID=1490495 RepID=A0A9W7CYT4_9STRA|nr:unnamed protein product [Phytophthora fragariaefolia]
MGTNGAQFERALEFVLRSDSTTKMPAFAKGTLPLQYENITTESVAAMRKNMGNSLWYRNFANNKQRHMQTHVYEIIGDDNHDTGSGEPVAKLKIRRPLTSRTEDEQHTTPTTTKKKRSLTPKKHQPVKIELEPLMEVEMSCELEAIDDTDSGNRQDGGRPTSILTRSHKKRLSISPTLSAKVSRNERHTILPRDTNAAVAMPRHVTVSMDEIIVDDDEDSESSGLAKPRSTRKSPDKSAGYLSDAANVKPRPSLLLNSDEDSEEEEKAVPRPVVKDVVRDTLFARRSVDMSPSEVLKQQEPESTDVTTPTARRQQRPTKRPKTPLSLVEQRIAFAKEVLRDLDKEKRQATKSVADKNPKTLSNSSSHGWLVETSFEFGLETEEELSHSFLSVGKPYSSDSKEFKGVPTPFDEPVAIDPPSEPKQSKRRKKADKKTLKVMASADIKQLSEEATNSDGDGEEKYHEVRRRFCVMQADLEGSLEIDGDEEATPNPKRTMISIPQKFNAPDKSASDTLTRPTDSMLHNSPPPLPLDDVNGVDLTSPSMAIFSSSEGFSMENCFTPSSHKKTQMGDQSDDDECSEHKQQLCNGRPLYTVRQPPLIQPLRLSKFTEKTCSHLGIPLDDLANDWVVLFQAISGGGRMGEGMPLQILDTVLLSPSGYDISSDEILSLTFGVV